MRMRKQPRCRRCDYDFTLEEGDRVFEKIGDNLYIIYDLYPSTGWRKRTAGELTPRRAKRLAYRDDEGLFCWHPYGKDK